MRNATSESPQVTPYAGRRVRAAVTEAPAPDLGNLDLTAEIPVVARQAAGGKRKAVKHAGARGPLFRGLPSAPLLLGVATLAVAISGVVISTPDSAETQLAASSSDISLRAATAASGVSGIGSVGTMRGRDLSRSSSREALQQAAGEELAEAAEAQVEVRNEALGQLQAKVEEQAKKLADNRWVQPLSPVVLTARYGQYGLWASYHTGLDFNGNTGDSIRAIAGGVVTFVGYDGAYGNKTVVTLDDGTEIWYAHQTSQYVSVGERVAASDVIGTVGSTGNVTGSHLHVEVRPGGGDPVDPYAAMVVNGASF
ncbi:M23 family metallopeptidase [Nocardioides sp.]|uniref:M23 family metallopeptidase n=1 Tax=Nocardioides sp. TaxID=35761 RepID=UPI002B26E46E|nr:M23 family metallopeptidase [Nocardioides sp.]